MLRASGDQWSSMARQRGAVGPGLILLMISMVLFLSLAVDTGRLYMEKRQLQKQADLAALSLSRSGCYLDGSTEDKAQALITLMKGNLKNNGFDPDANEYEVLFGAASINQADSRWEFDPDNSVKSAGKVTLTKTVPASLLTQMTSDERVTLSASATVMKRMSVGFGVGSRTIDVGLTNSVLGAALGGELSVGSYQGLADTQVRLAGLLSAMNDMGLLAVDVSAGTVEGILDTHLTVAQFIEANIQAVSEYAVLDADVLPALTQLDSLAKVSALSLTLSDIIQLAAGSNDAMNDEIHRAALASKITLFDLVSAAIYAANGNHAIEIDDLNVDTGLLGLGQLGVTVDATIIEPPKFTVGVLPVTDEQPGTKVETAQVRLKVGLDLPLNLLSLPGILDTDLSFGLAVDAAKANAELLDMTNCTSDGYQLMFDVTPALASVKLGSRSDVDQPAKLSAEVLSGLVGLDVKLSANVEKTDGSGIPLIVNAAHGDIPSVYSLTEEVSDNLDSLLSNENIIHVDTEIKSGLGSLGLDDAVDYLVNTTISGMISDLLSPVILLVSQQVLDPLLNLLGIQVGTADVFVSSIDVDGGGLIQ
ncbi:pilus assembly protein TadG-related protein [Photobacterium sp. R1]